jgi:hypothetical protein
MTPDLVERSDEGRRGLCDICGARSVANENGTELCEDHFAEYQVRHK